jgi:hypothetical protein
MVMIGIDAHKRSHTVVVIDAQGRELAQRTAGTTSADHLDSLPGHRRRARSDSGRLRTADTFPAVCNVICWQRGSGSSGCQRS